MRDSFKESGFSLIEILIVVVIGSIFLPMMTITIGGMSDQMMRSRQITIATDLTRAMMEMIVAKRFDENEPASPSTPASDWTAVGALGDDSETFPAYNDIDDFDGFSDTPITGYTRNVAVVYVDAPNYGSISLSPTNYKKITVSVTHGSIGTISLETLAGGWGN